MIINHSTVVVVADDGTSPVGTNEWNADLALSVISSDYLAQTQRLVITSTDRLTAAGTGRISVLEPPQTFLGTYAIAPTIYDGNYMLQYKQARLQGSARATIIGTGELYIFDLAPVGRLVLAGRGG